MRALYSVSLCLSAPEPYKGLELIFSNWATVSHLARAVSSGLLALALAEKTLSMNNDSIYFLFNF